MTRVAVIDNATAPTLWRAFAGFGLWAVCFTVLYTVHALGCTWFVTPTSDEIFLSPAMTGAVVWLLIIIWIFFILLLLVLTWRSAIRFRVMSRQPYCGTTGRMSRRFMLILTFVSDSTAVVITATSGLPIIMTPVCL